MKNAFIFTSNVNKPGRNDAKGAFVPCAEAFQKIHAVPPEMVYYFDWQVDKEELRRRIID